MEYFRKYCDNISTHAAAIGIHASLLQWRAMQKVRMIVRRPQSATGNFAAKSDAPKIFKDAASIQRNNGGYSKFNMPLSRAVHQSPVASICFASWAYSASS